MKKRGSEVKPERRKRPREEKDKACNGKVTIYLSPNMRRLLDYCAAQERVSANSICAFGVSVVLTFYKREANLPKEMEGVRFEIKKPGRRRIFTEVRR